VTAAAVAAALQCSAVVATSEPVTAAGPTSSQQTVSVRVCECALYRCLFVSQLRCSCVSLLRASHSTVITQGNCLPVSNCHSRFYVELLHGHEIYPMKKWFKFSRFCRKQVLCEVVPDRWYNIVKSYQPFSLTPTQNMKSCEFIIMPNGYVPVVDVMILVLHNLCRNISVEWKCHGLSFVVLFACRWTELS